MTGAGLGALLGSAEGSMYAEEHPEAEDAILKGMAIGAAAGTGATKIVRHLVKKQRLSDINERRVAILDTLARNKEKVKTEIDEWKKYRDKMQKDTIKNLYSVHLDSIHNPKLRDLVAELRKKKNHHQDILNEANFSDKNPLRVYKEHLKSKGFDEKKVQEWVDDMQQKGRVQYIHAPNIYSFSDIPWTNTDGADLFRKFRETELEDLLNEGLLKARNKGNDISRSTEELIRLRVRRGDQDNNLFFKRHLPFVNSGYRERRSYIRRTIEDILGSFKDDWKKYERQYKERQYRERKNRSWYERSNKQSTGRSSYSNSDVEILRRFGINTEASSAGEFKKSYRAAVMKHHPDRGGRTEDMQEINNAWDNLKKTDWMDKFNKG